MTRTGLVVAVVLVGASVLDPPASMGHRHSTPIATATPTPPTFTPHPAGPTPVVSAADYATLAARGLALPVAGVAAGALVRSFTDVRGGGRHEAIDIAAALGTPVVAVEDGTIAKLFASEAGGLTIYQLDPSGAYAYYYAHLERYADGLAEGQTVARGAVIANVGTSGNAGTTPHLHFAILKLGPERHWWQGAAIDPYPVFLREAGAASPASATPQPSATPTATATIAHASWQRAHASPSPAASASSARPSPRRTGRRRIPARR